MAYVIGRKVVKDSEEFDSYAYGITLPLKNGEGGFFEQAFTSLEQARTNLKNLLLTARGERIMQPEFGSGLKQLLFEPMDELFETNVANQIIESVSFWLPYITIQDIEIEMTDELKDNNEVNLHLKFTVGSNIDLQEITLRIQE